MDVSDLSSVQKAAKTWLMHNEETPMDMLFLNAGIFYDANDDDTALPLSKDGIEKVFATNVVGHHLLYRLLEHALQKSKMARVVSTSSVAGIGWLPPYSLPYRFGDTSPIIPATLQELNAGKPSSAFAFALYGRSKLAQAVWSKALTKRLGDQSTIYVNSAHPGAVFTPLAGGKYFPNWWPPFFSHAIQYLEEQLLWTSTEGALTELYLGVAMDEIREKNIRGRYYHPQSHEYNHPHAGDELLQKNVWNFCEELVKPFL
jgi:NAD(P)-dependent dehydrogenase (short-subunit alcohol dehydrogenase family)